MQAFIPLKDSLNNLLALARGHQRDNQFPSERRFHDGYIMALEHALDYLEHHARLAEIWETSDKSPYKETATK
jgi:hypothetical protein